MLRRSAIVGGGVVAVALGMGSCREPTQVSVEARTNVPYRPGLVVAFTVGGPGQTETSEPTTDTREPWSEDGLVGSLTVVPASTDNAELSVKLVLGIDRETDTCAPPDYAGCIVSRRRLRYSPHERLRLPVMLYIQCKDVPCDADTTCNALGQCVSAEVDCTADNTCALEGELGADAGGPNSVLDAATSDGAGPDAGAHDASDERDATTDGSPGDGGPGDGGPGDGGPGDGGSTFDGGGRPGFVTCAGAAELECDLSISKCCYDNSADHGVCVGLGTSCQAIHVPLLCDGDDDCGAGSCCAHSGGTSCVLSGCAGGTVQVCHSSGVCSSGTCSGSVYGLQTCK